MAKTTLNIQVDTDVKEQSEMIFKHLGLSMTSAINLFLKAVIYEQGIPFELEPDLPNEETVSAIEEGRKMMSDPSAPRYSSMDELKAALDS